MDSNILTVVGIVITITFGIPAYLALRKNQKTKIFFFKKQFLNLHEDLTKHIPDLEITYKGEPIRSTMFFLKGIFICSGKDDIVAADIQKGITMTIAGSEALWHSFKIINRIKDLEIKHHISDAELIIDFPLLKDEDFFIVEALGQTDKMKVDFNHRISKVPDIQHSTVGIEKGTKISLHLSFALLILMLLPIVQFFSILNLDSMLKETYYNKENRVVDIHHINHILETSSKSWFNVDSVRKIAKKEYSMTELLFTKGTKRYRVNNYYSITFYLEIKRYDLVILIPIIFSVTLLVTLLLLGENILLTKMLQSWLPEYLNNLPVDHLRFILRQ